MSHKEHIAVFLNQSLKDIRNPADPEGIVFNKAGFTKQQDFIDEVLFTKMHHATEIIWRDTAEFWDKSFDPTEGMWQRHRQILPYALLSKRINGVKMYGVYQRVKGIGETRLLKGHTMGFGGHLPGIDVKYDKHSGIDVIRSIIAGLGGELMQEAHVDLNDIGHVSHRFHGYIMADTNEVDALHFAFVMGVEVDEDYPVVVDEKGLAFKGWYSKEGIMHMHETLPVDVKFENWTRFIIEAGVLED